MSRDTPVFPRVQMNLVRPKAPVIGRVISNEMCLNGKSSSFVKHLVVDVSGTPLAGSFIAGQSFGVITPGTDERGKAHKVRLYSIACPSWGEDGQGNWLSTTPKRLIDEFVPHSAGDDVNKHELFLGVCSNYLCDLDQGDEVQLTGPNGKRFVLPTDAKAHDYLFVATGTGIAPFRGMILELLEARGRPCDSRIDLVMGTPYTTDLLYHSLFCRLADVHDNFHYHWAVSRETQRDGSAGLYVDRYIHQHMDVFAGVLANPRTLVYVCGLDGMQFGLFKVIAEHDLTDGIIIVDPLLATRLPQHWTPGEIKSAVKPTARCMLEVY